MVIFKGGTEMILILILGILLILFFIFLQLSKSRCKMKIDDIYLRYNTYKAPTGGYGIITSYSPVFRYEFNGKQYEVQTFETLTKKEVCKLIVGNKYEIFINENKPQKFIIYKSVRFSEVITLLMGIFFSSIAIIFLL